MVGVGPIGGAEGMDRLGAKLSDEEKKAAGLSVISDIPLQRWGHIGDVANATVFLFSEAANWVTGQVLVSSSTFLTRLSLIGFTLGCRRRSAAYTGSLTPIPFWNPGSYLSPQVH